jgi:hypothetical protein
MSSVWRCKRWRLSWAAPSLDLMYRQNLTFVDPNPELGQTFPGFEIEVPRLED